MERKQIYRVVEWVIALAVCAYFIERLVTYEDYASLWACLSGMGASEWCALGLCVVLMPVNMAIEIWRWQTLYNGERLQATGDRLRWSEARRQVYYSKMAGLVTPWHLGEYPARAMMQGEWTKTLSMGAVGSATMTLAIIIAGLAGIAFSPSVLDYTGDRYLYALIPVVVVGCVLTLLLPRLLRRWVAIDEKLVLRSMLQSGVRLLCWCVQLALVLYAFGHWPFDASKPLVYYLLVTVTPNMPVAEIGVRGAWAMVVFGTMNAALASVVLWAINSLFPCLIWLIIRKK